MPRIVKEHTVRRNEILDATERLIFSKGYEQMTVQDILDMLQISKGAFYHYFDSKQALLDALIDRMTEQVLPLLAPIVEDPTLPALEKFDLFFRTASSWKTAKKDYLLQLFRVWYNDHNALFRQKQVAALLSLCIPMLSAIFRQGVQEGVFHISNPDQTSELIMQLLQDAGDSIANLLMSCEPCDNLEKVVQITAAYTEALNRILGVPEGTLKIIDDKTLEEWFAPTTYEILNGQTVAKESRK